jgi:pyridoxine kinase
LLVVDPVMGDGGKLYHGFDLSFAARMRHLCTRAHVITPNATEAALLTGRDSADMTDAATQRAVVRELRDMGPRAVALTGALREDGTVGYLFCDGDQIVDDVRHAHYDRPLHGCGDVFASALCCALLRGKPAQQAFRLAADFTLYCIEKTVPDAPAHWYGLRVEDGLGRLAQMLPRD